MDINSLIQWSVILIISLFVLVKAADLFIAGAKEIGEYFKMSQFVIGVLIVGMGTSLPELASSLAGAWSGETEIVLANAVGSNITNILLIVGVLAFLGGKVIIKQELIKTELVVFFIATVNFIAVVFDGRVDRVEGLLLLGTFSAYIWYLFMEAKQPKIGSKIIKSNSSFPFKALIISIFSLTALLVGASYTIDMAVNIATAFAVPIGLISITAIAIGTSLPELFVSIQAIKTKQTEMAIGNIFGSNAFNMLVVVGLPALIVPLSAGVVVMKLGLGIMIASSAIFFVIGLARQVMRWEGLMMLIFFLFFLIKLMAFI